MNKLTIESFLRLLLILGLLVALLFVLYRFLTLIIYFLIALVASYALDPVVNRLQAAGLNRTLAISTVLTGLLLVLIWFSTSFLPIIVQQTVILGQQLNADDVVLVVAQIEDQVREHIPFFPDGILRDNITTAVSGLFQVDDFTRTFNHLFGIFANIFWAFLVIPFATFFILKDGALIRRSILQTIPNRYFESSLTGLQKIEQRLVIYFKSVGLQCLIIAVVATLTLTLAGLNNALSIGIVVGLANIIPYFGPIIGYLLSIIVAVLETGDFSLIIYVLTAIAITQIVDNILVQPLLFSRSANLHPLVVLFVVLTGAELAGIFGMIIAVPSTVILVITIKQVRWSVDNYHIFRSRGNVF